MNEDDFKKALKCIAIIQSNGNMDDIAVNLKKIYPLPDFDYEVIREFKEKALDQEIHGKKQGISLAEEISFESPKKPSPKKSLPHEEEKVKFSQESSKRSTFASSSKSEEKKVGDGLVCSVPIYETINQGWLGMTSYTQYKIVTSAYNIPNLKSDDEYVVWRRFSDFEWLHNTLIQQDEYKGLIFPTLPEKPYLTKQDESFLEKRKDELQTYLRSLCQHKIVRESRTFHLFLTIDQEGEFNSLKTDQASLQSKLLDYAVKIKNFDMDHFVTNLSQYFDSQEPEKFTLGSPYKSKIESLLDYEKQLQCMVS